MRANEFIKEARRNNFGREISNVQGQALGKKLAAGDPRAQQALAQAKAAQKTNVGDMYGKNMDTLGLTTPQQRLAANKAAAAKYGPDMSVDPDEVRTSQQPTNNPQNATKTPATDASTAASAWDKTKDTASKAKSMASNTLSTAGNAATNAYDAVAGAKDRFSQSKVGQALGGWSQRLVGVGNRQAAAQQYWMKSYIGMVNNLVANAKNSNVPFDFSDAMVKYMTKQKIQLDPTQIQNIKAAAQATQENGYQRKDVINLGRAMWSAGVNANKVDTATTGPSAAAVAQPATDTTEKPAQPATDTTEKPAQPATPKTVQDFANGGYNSVKMNAPTGVPQVGGKLPQATTTAQPTQAAAPSAAKAPVTKTQVPVGTKFALPTKNGDKFIAQKTDTGWKVGGSMITDPKQVEKLEMQATQATPQKGARATNVKRGGVKKLNPAVAANKPVTKKPVRKLNAPSALAKGTTDNPAKQGKSRIRPS